VVGGFLDPVRIVPSSFHDAGVGAVPAPRVEVLRPGDVGRDLGSQGGRVVRGKSRADGPADDPQGPGELNPVRVDPSCGGRSAGQGADRVVGQPVAPDLLLDQRKCRARCVPDREDRTGTSRVPTDNLR
jgi:hypothetical protein